MTSLLEGARRLVTRGTDIGQRIEALDAATTAARGHLDDALVDDVATVVERASSRLRLSADHTVVALAGATGSGKSSTFNAFNGLDLAAVGVRRPTTSWASLTAGSLRAGRTGSMRRRSPIWRPSRPRVLGQVRPANYPPHVSDRTSMARTEPGPARSRGEMGELVRATRPRQWSKNLLVFAAPLLSGRFTEIAVLAGLEEDLAWLDARLRPGSDGLRLAALPLGDLRARLADLASRPERVSVLPQVTATLDELRNVGLGDLVEDLARRGIGTEQVIPLTRKVRPDARVAVTLEASGRASRPSRPLRLVAVRD